MTREQLSICVPAYNAGRTLALTLESVLGQAGDFEVVVLDNASSDDTQDILRLFDDTRLKLFRNDSVLSIGDNWNKVVQLSNGSLVKVVCADDIMMPGSLGAQLEVMQDPSIVLSSAKFAVIDEAGVFLETGLGIPDMVGSHSAQKLARSVVRRGPADFGPTAAAMFRREHFDTVGGFRGDLVFPMDVDLFVRVSSFGRFFGMTEQVAAWRNSSFNLCSQTSTASKLSDMARFHHRIAREYPGLVSPTDVYVGHVRLLRTALWRLRVRSRSLLGCKPGT